jgi:hypothetical protein
MESGICRRVELLCRAELRLDPQRPEPEGLPERLWINSSEWLGMDLGLVLVDLDFNCYLLYHLLWTFVCRVHTLLQPLVINIFISCCTNGEGLCMRSAVRGPHAEFEENHI